MKSTIALSLLLLVGTDVLAADKDASKYAPSITGRLTRGGQPIALGNVCLRSAGTEIRQCAYADFDGRFYLPTLGAVQPARTDDDQTRVDGAYPAQWLELGTRGDGVTKLFTVELVNGRKSAIHLDCDIARQSAQAGEKPAYCQVSPERTPASTPARR
ncbi:MAG: hypothetical protein ABW187_00730 [Dokdonella sp.]